MNAVERTKLILRRYGLKPKERFGQRFLVDEDAMQRQVEYAELSKDDTVLEIGAGIGNLTEHLLGIASMVIVIEKDRDMIRVLRERFRGIENFEVLEGDVLKIVLPEFNKTVSNIPYSISSPLTFKLLKHGFDKAVLTFQKEFAERMVAIPGDRNYSRLSVATYYYANVKIQETLSPRCFYPEPEVSSAIVEIVPRTAPFKVNEELFFRLIRGLFVHKKKTLRNALLHSSTLIFNRKLDKDEMVRIMEQLPQEMLKRRVFELSPEKLADVTDIINNVMV